MTEDTLTTENDELEPESPEGASGDDHENNDEGGDAGDSSTAERESSSGNRFAGLGSRLSDRMSATDDDDDDDDDIDDEDLDEDSDDATEGDEDGSDGEGQDTDKPKKGGEQDDDDEDDSSSRFEIVDAEGSKYELEFPEGATIRFAGDGKTVEAKSIDELVQFAQKGVAFDRVTSQQGQKVATLSSRLTELEEDLTADRELVRALVTGKGLSDEDLAALEAYYAKLEDDPEALEKEEALREKREREAAEKEKPANTGEGVAAFWGATKEAAAVEVEKFEYLEPDDVPEILSRFNENYLARREELVKEFVRIAPQHGVSPEDAVRQADAAAIDETLNRKTLRRVMRELDSKFAKRADKVRGSRQTRETKEAEGHNRRVEAQRDRARNPANRSLRSGGASLNTRQVTPEKDKPKNFEGRIDKSLSRFARLRRSKQDDDDDDE